MFSVHLKLILVSTEELHHQGLKIFGLKIYSRNQNIMGTSQGMKIKYSGYLSHCDQESVILTPVSVYSHKSSATTSPSLIQPQVSSNEQCFLMKTFYAPNLPSSASLP